MIKSKSKGSVEMIGGIIVLATLTFIIVFLVAQQLPLKNKTQVEADLRKTMFKMEQDGYLNDVNKQDLLIRLQKNNCENIIINATNTKVAYGTDIKLDIEYDCKIKNFTLGDGLIPTFEDAIVRVKISKSTVSKAT